ncbi:MAG: universal stress protein [Methyloligellaceae bacterium]
MTIKDIILHQGPDARSAARLDVAVALAKAHEARIIGVFAKADPEVPRFWLAPMGEKWVEELRALLQDKVAESESAFGTRMKQEGLAGEWRVMTGLPTEVMSICARYGDLTVIGQSNPDEPTYGGAIPDHVVLGSGGPVLLVPYAGDIKAVGRRILVAWNGTREAARAVRDAMPLLRTAETVIVYVVNPPDDRHLAGAEICAHLARHGVKAEAGHAVFGAESDAVDPSLTTVGDFGFQGQGAWTLSRHPSVGDIAVGDALLNAVSENAVDLLVMGAYGHSRVRELILGGATRHVLKTMTVPVLMSN